MAVPLVSSPGGVIFAFRVAGVALRDIQTFCNVSKIILCGRRNTFATFSEDALQFSWQAQHFGRVHRHFAWQAQHFRRVVLRGFSPHLCVGFLFLILHPVRPPVLPSSRRQHSLLTHNLLTQNLLTQNFHTHNLLTYLLTHNLHTQLAHTQLAHTELAHTHTTYSHTVAGVALQLAHTELAHTHNLLTYNLLTHNTAYSHTTCSHRTCTHTHTLEKNGSLK